MYVYCTIFNWSITVRMTCPWRVHSWAGGLLPGILCLKGHSNKPPWCIYSKLAQASQFYMLLVAHKCSYEITENDQALGHNLDKWSKRQVMLNILGDMGTFDNQCNQQSRLEM